MPRLPDRFDHWVRRARASSDPARQVDYILGALLGLTDWYFLDQGPAGKRQPARAEIDDSAVLLVFSEPGRIGEIAPASRLPVIAMPSAGALAWCVEQQLGLLVNPGEDAVLLPAAHVALFHSEWTQRGGRQAEGFWIPNLSSEEEEFWREHGL